MCIRDSPQYVWGNDVMLPVNSYYKVTGYTSAGQISFGCLLYTSPVDGVFSPEKFAAAEVEYRKAVAFETNNTASGSVICKFSKWDEKSEQWVDATNDYRQAVKNSNLR